MIIITKQEALNNLGLQDLNSSETDIKKAFRKMAKQYHPDVVGDSGKDKFMQIQESYDALTNGIFSASPIQVTHSSIFKVVRTA